MRVRSATMPTLFITCLVVITFTGDTTEDVIDDAEENSVVNAEAAPTPIVIYIQQSSPMSNQQAPPNQPYYQQQPVYQPVQPYAVPYQPQPVYQPQPYQNSQYQQPIYQPPQPIQPAQLPTIQVFYQKPKVATTTTTTTTTKSTTTTTTTISTTATTTTTKAATKRIHNRKDNFSKQNFNRKNGEAQLYQASVSMMPMPHKYSSSTGNHPYKHQDKFIDQKYYQTSFITQHRKKVRPYDKYTQRISTNRYKSRPNFIQHQNNFNNRPIRPQSPLQNNQNSYIKQQILRPPSKQTANNPNYANSLYVTSTPKVNSQYTTTNNQNSFEAIKDYFVKTFLSQPARTEGSRVEEIPLVGSSSYDRIRRDKKKYYPSHANKDSIFGKLGPSSIFQHLLSTG